MCAEGLTGLGISGWGRWTWNGRLMGAGRCREELCGLCGGRDSSTPTSLCRPGRPPVHFCTAAALCSCSANLTTIYLSIWNTHECSQTALKSTAVQLCFLKHEELHDKMIFSGPAIRRIPSVQVSSLTRTRAMAAAIDENHPNGPHQVLF